MLLRAYEICCKGALNSCSRCSRRRSRQRTRTHMHAHAPRARAQAQEHAHEPSGVQKSRSGKKPSGRRAGKKTRARAAAPWSGLPNCVPALSSGHFRHERSFQTHLRPGSTANSRSHTLVREMAAFKGPRALQGALVVVLLALAAAGACVQAQQGAAGAPSSQQASLPSFLGVVSCAPFTVLVLPADGGSSVRLEAAPDVSSAVALQVVRGAVGGLGGGRGKRVGPFENLGRPRMHCRGTAAGPHRWVPHPLGTAGSWRKLHGVRQGDALWRGAPPKSLNRMRRSDSQWVPRFLQH